MMYARDYRRIGRESLRGMWPTAILASFVSGLLGCTMYGSSWINLNNVVQGNASVSDMSDTYAVAEISDSAIQNFVESDFFMPMIAFLGMLLTVLLIYALVCVIIGGAITLGYARFNLNLVDGNQARAGDVVVLAGKGHETYQEIAGRRIPMDERKIVAEWFARGEERRDRTSNYVIGVI